MRKKLFIIEDDNMLRENIVSFLTRYGYEVYASADGKEALNKITEVNPDLIICDIMLPGMDGYEVLDNIRANTEYKQTPFIYITAKSTMADLRKGMNLGADDYIVKPFKYDDLLIAIETRLKRKAASGTGSKPNKSSSKSVIKEDELWIESEDAIEKYPVKSIIYLSKILNGTVLYIDALGEKVALNQDFDKLINLLAPLQFKQINENVAVNTGFIDTVRRSGINAGELVMKSVIKPFTIEPGFLSGFDNY